MMEFREGAGTMTGAETGGNLWERYFEESKVRLADLARHCAALRTTPAERAHLEALQAVFHAFAGSGALYGLPEVSALGGDGEYVCYSLTLAGAPITEEDVDRIEDLGRRIRNAFQGAGEKAARTTETMARAQQRTAPLVFLVTANALWEDGLVEHLSKRGLQVKVADSPAGALVLLQQEIPDLALVGAVLPTGSGYDLVKAMRAERATALIPVLLLGGGQAFMEKVEALGCGADGFVAEPVDPALVYRKAKALLQRHRAASARILAVEDDPAQARFIASTLEHAGYRARVVQDPEEFEKAIHEFRPNLVLMDVLLPKVSGFDLVRFLRQEEGFAAVPVVYLTTEARSRSQVMGAEAGGDDYLVKPVSAADLLATIRSRLIRYRSLQELMDHDELTALLAHTPFLQQARLCLSRFSRGHATYALAILRIDRLDAVASRTDPKVRDTVLQGLARFLQRRVRQTDVMGRFADDSIAVVLEQITEADAVKLMRKIVQEFAALEHPMDVDRSVRGTVSIGLAMTAPGLKTLKEWLDQAHSALQAAVHQGGNRVVLPEAK